MAERSIEAVSLDLEAIRQKAELDLQFIRQTRERLPARVTKFILESEANERQRNLHRKAGRLFRLLWLERQKRAEVEAALAGLAERCNRFLATGKDKLGLAVACGEILRGPAKGGGR